MANVTYLLGAGASYNALPVVDEVPDAIRGIIGELTYMRNNPDPVIYHFSDRKANEAQENYRKKLTKAIDIAIDDLSKLEKGCQNHLSIDTYAKMLFLTEDEDYERVKNTIALFFELSNRIRNKAHQLYLLDKDYKIKQPQTRNDKYRQTEKLDKRYDAFFASILETSFDNLPKNIKILSWNYDDQLEKSYHNYLYRAPFFSLEQAAANEQIYAYENIDEHINIYQRNHENPNVNIDNFCTIKINGSAKFIDINKNAFIYDFDNKRRPPRDVKTCLISYLAYTEAETKFKSAISFAWDNPEETNTMLKTAKSATRHTDYLVIIGYSLPFFNRRIDKEIIQNMKSLKRIYIQDPNPEEIRDRVLGILPHFTDKEMERPIVLIKNTKQFHLPNELT